MSCYFYIFVLLVFIDEWKNIFIWYLFVFDKKHDSNYCKNFDIIIEFYFLNKEKNYVYISVKKKNDVEFFK